MCGTTHKAVRQVWSGITAAARRHRDHHYEGVGGLVTMQVREGESQISAKWPLPVRGRRVVDSVGHN